MNSTQLPAEVTEFAQSNNFIPIQELPSGYCSRIFTDGNRILKAPFQGEERTTGARAAILIQQVNGPKIYAHDETTGALIMEHIPGGKSLLDQSWHPSSTPLEKEHSLEAQYEGTELEISTSSSGSSEAAPPPLGEDIGGGQSQNRNNEKNQQVSLWESQPCYVSTRGKGLGGVGQTPELTVFIPLARAMSMLPATNFPLLANFYKNPPEIAKKLIETTPKHVFLHGDLHHENILFDERTSTYRPIDPKGLIGDPNYEPVAFLRNPILTLPDHPNLYKFTYDRIISISKALNLDPFRIAAWLYIDRYCDLQEDPNPRWQSVLPTFNQLMTDFKM